MTNDPAAYLDVALGVDCYRDASAVIRAVSAHDAEGAYAVMTGTDAPRHVALALATIVVHVCHLGGLDHDAITHLLSRVCADSADILLDQPRPDAPSQAGGA